MEHKKMRPDLEFNPEIESMHTAENSSSVPMELQPSREEMHAIKNSMCDLKDMDLNKMIDFLKRRREQIVIYDLANRARFGERENFMLNSFYYVNSAENLNLNAFNIYVMNNNCARELGLPLVNDDEIIVLNGRDRVFNSWDPNLRTEKFICVITQDKIECDDKVAIYIAYRINDISRTSIVSADDYTRPL